MGIGIFELWKLS